MAVKAKAEITLSHLTDIISNIRYYLLQSSTSAKPSKPTDGSEIGSEWIEIEPSYSSDNTMTLYFVDKTVFSNGDIKYSEVSLSSSYEAAKEAWNKANNAQNTADDAQEKITYTNTLIDSNSEQINLRIDQTEKSLNGRVDLSNELIGDINGWQMIWNKIMRTTDADVEEYQDYIDFIKGDIILGESKSDLKLKLTKNSIQFKGTGTGNIIPDSDATAWITGQAFNINEGEIHTSLKVGQLQFVPRPNGNFAISII